MVDEHKSRHQANFDIGQASFMVPLRKDEPELLDQGIGSPSDVRANLKEMWVLNRYFGGISALTHHLYPMMLKCTEPVRVVDVGTGSGEMGSLLMAWGKHNNQQVLIYALDKSARNLAVARENSNELRGLSLIQADAIELPFAVRAVDFFVSSLFLHHLTPEQVVVVLRETFNRARRGIVMSDLVRSRFPMMAFGLIQPLFAKHYLTHHDGRLSIERAYTASELRTLAKSAGLQNAQVYSHFPWRMTLVAEKSIV